jgi:predicted CoA-binding protein
LSLLGQYLLDQPSLDVDMADIFVSPEEWTGFLQEVLETTVAAYHILKRENTVRSSWEEDKFTIHMERCYEST